MANNGTGFLVRPETGNSSRQGFCFALRVLFPGHDGPGSMTPQKRTLIGNDDAPSPPIRFTQVHTFQPLKRILVLVFFYPTPFFLYIKVILKHVISTSPKTHRSVSFCLRPVRYLRSWAVQPRFYSPSPSH